MGCTTSADDVQADAHDDTVAPPSSPPHRRPRPVTRDRDPFNCGISSRWQDRVPPLAAAAATLEHRDGLSASINASRAESRNNNHSHTNNTSMPPPSVASTVQPSSHRTDVRSSSNAGGGTDSQHHHQASDGIGSLASPTGDGEVLDFAHVVGPLQLPTRPPSALHSPDAAGPGLSSMPRSPLPSPPVPATPDADGGEPAQEQGVARVEMPRRNPLEGPPVTDDENEDVAPFDHAPVDNPDGDARAPMCRLPGSSRGDGAADTHEDALADAPVVLPPTVYANRGRQRLPSSSDVPSMVGSKLRSSASQFMTGSQLSSTLHSGSVRE